MFIIDSILLSPISGLLWLGKKIDEVAAKELCDEDRIKEKLMELQLKFELDEITEEEYEKQEKEIMKFFEKECENN